MPKMSSTHIVGELRLLLERLGKNDLLFGKQVAREERVLDAVGTGCRVIGKIVAPEWPIRPDWMERWIGGHPVSLVSSC
jgi:hypothetical protein